MVDPLEQRVLLSTINWVNKGSSSSNSDSFNSTYGINATLARAIVQRAIDDWERIILNFNRSSGTNTYNVTINAADLGGTGRGRTNNFTWDAQGKPLSCTITLDDTGGDGGGGWYFDPEPGLSNEPDDSEFTFVDNPFQAHNVFLGTDYYRTILHELCHAMGFATSSTRLQGVSTDIGLDPNGNGTTDHLFTVDSNGNPGADYTYTNVGGAHMYEGPSVGGCPIFPDELMNSGRAAQIGQRNLIDDNIALLLGQVFGYSIHMPSQQNTFYVQLDLTNNKVTVNGDIKSDGFDSDYMEFSISGGFQKFMINGTTEGVDITEFFSSTINANADSDYMLMDSYWSPVTVNAGAGNDTLILSQTSRDLFKVPYGITYNGSLGFDEVRMYDSNANRSDTYTITPTFVGRPAFTLNMNAVESVDLTAQMGLNEINITPDPATRYRIDGAGGTDIIAYNDLNESVAHQYTLSTGQLLCAGRQAVSFPATTETVRIDAGSGDDAFTFIPGDNYPFIGLDGNGGNDSLLIDDRADTGNDDYYLYGNQFYKYLASVPGGGNLSYSIFSDIETTTFQANDGNNFIGEYGAFSPTFIFGNGGNDHVVVNDGTATVNTGSENGLVAPFGDYIGVNLDAQTGEDYPATVVIDQDDEVRDFDVESGQTIGTLQINTGAVLRRSAGSGAGLTNNGTIDLAGGALLVQSPGPTAAAWRASIISGRNGGAWTGTVAGSVNSSLAAGTPLLIDGVGYGLGSQIGLTSVGAFPIGLNDMLLRYTLMGDANLDKKVDVVDLGVLAGNWQGSPRVFTQADFDYNGVVDVDDLGSLATNWQQALAPAPAVESGARFKSRRLSVVEDLVGV
jgi:hypothetical protein